MAEKQPAEGLNPKRSEMVAILQRYVKPVQRTEILPFDECRGRVAAKAVCSLNTLPNQPTSRFDGIAVRYRAFEKGPPDTSHWVEGQDYCYSNTGVAMPDGFDTVIAIEEVVVTETGLVIAAQPARRGELVNKIGSSLEQGEPLIQAGEVITPAHIGLFAAGGVAEVEVFCRPKVGVIPTGDELVPPCATPPAGKNIESNSYMIAAYLEGWGARPKVYPIVQDAPEAIAEALKLALKENDAAVIIAGSSLGTKDYTIQVLRQLGQVVVPQLAHGPGRKSSFSMVEEKPVLGVAGPPLGAQITCDLYLNPFVSALCGLPHVELRPLQVLCDDSFAPRQTDFCERVLIYRGEDGYHIRSAFAPKTTRPQMQALSTGNFYRVAGTSCKAGETTVVELLCPLEYLPQRDILPDLLGEEVQPYE